MIIQVDKTDQHKKRTEKCIDKKLKCDHAAVLTTPNQADKINRNQRQFPEHIKQKSVLSCENAYQRHLHQQNKSIKILWISVSILVGRKNDQRYKKGCQQHQ